MFKIARLLAVVLALVAFAACSHAKSRAVTGPTVTNNETDNSGLEMEMGWVKTKPRSVDMKITLTNKYKHWVAFDRAGWKLVFNGEEAELTKFPFTGELADGAISSNVVSFKFNTKLEGAGHGVLTIDPIYKEESQNGAARTKLAPLKFEFDTTK